MRAKRIKRQGFVVVVVLCVVIALSVLLLAFNAESRANLHAVEDFRKSAQALNCARAGLNIAIAAAKNFGDTRVDRSLHSVFSGEKAIALDQGQCLITVSDESGKLNVNLLKEANGRLNRTLVEHFLRLIDRLNQQRSSESRIEYSIVPSIMDWIDSDDEVTSLPFVKRKNLGAESSYYIKSGPSHGCKDASVGTIEELLAVKGISPEVLDSLRDCLTVYGDGKININAASKLMLVSLSENMDRALVQVIIERRSFKPFEAIGELRELPGMTDSLYHAIRRTLTVDPKDLYYTVTSRGDVDHLSCTVTATLRINEQTKSVEVVFYKEIGNSIVLTIENSGLCAGK